MTEDLLFVAVLLFPALLMIFARSRPGASGLLYYVIDLQLGTLARRTTGAYRSLAFARRACEGAASSTGRVHVVVRVVDACPMDAFEEIEFGPPETGVASLPPPPGRSSRA